MRLWLKNTYSEHKGFLLFIALMVIFRSSLADINVVPTGSMQPTIVEGDRILVNKVAYDLRLPLSDIKLTSFADPSRGDIVVFESKASDKRLVKRVIGVPGDVIAMRDNVLTINGQQLSYRQNSDSKSNSYGNKATQLHTDLSEDLLGFEHSIRIQQRGSNLSSFPAVQVPEGFYLALGDSRDNSADSRVIGFIPRDEIIGRSRHVAVSLNADNYYLPRTNRFLKAL